MGTTSKRKEKREPDASQQGQKAPGCALRSSGASVAASSPPNDSSAAERSARKEIEQRIGHPFSDNEWEQQKHRLVEFVQILSGWGAEQNTGNIAPKIPAKPEVDACIETNQKLA